MMLTADKRRALCWLLVAWAVTSATLALLPAGAGGWPRATDVLIFMVFGPVCLTVLARPSLPLPVAVTAGLGVSLGLLVVTSQALLLLQVWRPWAVTALIAVATVAGSLWVARRAEVRI
jgi:hypothetical protein